MYSVINNIRITGVSAAVPKTSQEIINSSYGAIEDREKFSRTTGIKNRRLSNPDQCTSDFCFAAAERLIKDLELDKNNIKVLILITQTPDYIMPATAIVLQERLGLSKGCAAFDINLGCSGYPFGIMVAASMLSAIKSGQALLLVGDTPTKNDMPSRISTIPPLFGDAGTATLLEYNENASPIYIDLASDGKGYDTIIHPYGMYRNLYTPDNLVTDVDQHGYVHIEHFDVIDGLGVFNFSVDVAPKSIKNIMKETNHSIDDIDFYVLHQANKLMNETIRKVLKIPVEKHPYTLDKYGNTSSATIPLTIVSELRDKLSDGSKHKLLLCGFGVGLSWGSAIVEVENLYCPEVIEI